QRFPVVSIQGMFPVVQSKEFRPSRLVPHLIADPFRQGTCAPAALRTSLLNIVWLVFSTVANDQPRLLPFCHGSLPSPPNSLLSSSSRSSILFLAVAGESG